MCEPRRTHEYLCDTARNGHLFPAIAASSRLSRGASISPSPGPPSNYNPNTGQGIEQAIRGWPLFNHSTLVASKAEASRNLLEHETEDFGRRVHLRP